MTGKYKTRNGLDASVNFILSNGNLLGYISSKTPTEWTPKGDIVVAGVVFDMETPLDLIIPERPWRPATKHDVCDDTLECRFRDGAAQEWRYNCLIGYQQKPGDVKLFLGSCGWWYVYCEVREKQK